MRLSVALAFLLAAAAAGCKEKPAAEGQQAPDQAFERDALDSNDLTAIDAASGAASNMAADLDIANMALDDDAANASEGGRRTAPRRERSSGAAADSDADAPASNSGNADATAEEPASETGD